jgi:hypothetical protein
LYVNNTGARSIVFGWDTMLQAGRLRVQFPMRSLNYSIDINPPGIFPVIIGYWIIPLT